MANQLYQELETLVTDYIGHEHADHALHRQLERCNATPDTLTKANVKEILNFLLGSTTLYLHPDKTKQAELTAKIKALT